MNTIKTIALAGGCFWCTEAIFLRVRGVQSVVSGYTGGHTENPNYEDVCTGETGHAECVLVTYDSAEISTSDILSVFFATHDPTTKDRQGNDVGPQYRSAIFYTDDEQENEAKSVVTTLEHEGVSVVTEILPLQTFYKAEVEHAEYFERNKDRNPYCTLVIYPKIEKFEKRFHELMSEKPLSKSL